MHFVKAKHLLSPKNGINIYRGCSHGCIYCDSRSDCYQMNHSFTDIEVKENAIELLRGELSSKREKIMIGTGSMSDPYMPLEEKLLFTRRTLETVLESGNGITVITKSDLVLRDLDLFKKINEKSRAVLQMTLTTADEELCKILEPNVCSTARRVEVLKEFADNGIETVVWFVPILPFINDSMDNMKRILNYCLDAKVSAIIYFGAGVTLRDGDREYFYQNLDKYFPNMKEKYVKTYKDMYDIKSPNNAVLTAYFNDFCLKHNIKSNIDEIFSDLRDLKMNQKYKQISLFD